MRFLDFAGSGEAVWKANFRDLNAAIIRMATLAPGGRINVDVVQEEIERLKRAWAAHAEGDEAGEVKLLDDLLGEERVSDIDPFDRPQLAHVIKVCRQAGSLSEAGRRLFAVSRRHKKQANDADRLRKYLARFSLEWQIVAERAKSKTD